MKKVKFECDCEEILCKYFQVLNGENCIQSTKSPT